MRKSSAVLRLTLLIALIGSLVFAASVAMAQEGEPTPVTAEGEAGPAATEGESTVGEPGAEGEVAGTEGEAAETEEAAEPAANPLTPLGINVGFLVAQIVNFLLIFLLLRFLLWKPLSNMLDSRAAKIQKGLEDASAAANARRNAESEAEKILSAARADASREIEAARGRGEEVARQVIAEANQEAERIRAEARARGEEERNKQLAEMRSQVANISVAVAQRLIGETLDQKRQQALINDFFSKVPAGAAAMNGLSVEVVSAMPLSADEQARIKREIGASEINFTVDPNILGGLVIRSADRVVDGSVRSGLTELAGRLR